MWRETSYLAGNTHTHSHTTHNITQMVGVYHTTENNNWVLNQVKCMLRDPRDHASFMNFYDSSLMFLEALLFFPSRIHYIMSTAFGLIWHSLFKLLRSSMKKDEGMEEREEKR